MFWLTDDSIKWFSTSPYFVPKNSVAKSLDSSKFTRNLINKQELIINYAWTIDSLILSGFSNLADYQFK